MLGKSSVVTGYSLGSGGGGTVLARSGAITLIGENANASADGLNIGGLTLGAKAGSGVTSSSSNITLKASQFGLNNTTRFETSGTVSVLPLDAANSFGSAQSFNSYWSFANTVSALTIGKSTNDTNLTILNSTSIAGPINIYGGTIALNAGLTTTNTTTGDVNITATGLTGTGGIGLATGRGLSITQSGNSSYGGVVSGSSATLTKAGARA